MEPTKLMGTIVKYTLLVLVAVVPLLFIPLTPNIFATPKLLILVIASVIVLAATGIESLRSKHITLPGAALAVPVVLFLVALMVNLIINPEGRVEALTGRAALYISCALLSFVVGSMTTSTSFVKRVLYVMIGSSSILALHGLCQLIFIYKIPGIPNLLSDKAFTLTGSPLVTTLIITMGAIATYIEAARVHKGTIQYTLLSLGILQTITAVAYLSLMLPGGQLTPSLLPYSAAWAVALDALKSTRILVWGIGIANFTSLYTAVKPTSLNLTSYWNVLPTSSSSELLQLLTTTGVVGIATFLTFVVTTIARIRTSFTHEPALAIVFLFSFASLVLTPVSAPILLLFFASAGLIHSHHAKTYHMTPLVGNSVGIILLAGVLPILYFAATTYRAENHMFQATRALAVSDGKTVYEQHQKALALLPRSAGYHLSYSQVNLSLAGALSQKADLTDAERQQVATLVSQAIREAKAVVELKPSDARGWQNLGSIYRNLINVAEGADEFAVSSYAQAVMLDPGNPALRVEFGGLLYQLVSTRKDKEQQSQLLARAIEEFQTAIQIKPDYANAYYNVSKALEAAGNIPAAHAAMQKALAALDPTSSDVEKATAELELLKNKLPKASASPTLSGNPTSTSNLQPPSPLPSAIPGGPLTLPDATPSTNQ